VFDMTRFTRLGLAALFLFAPGLTAQDFATDDPVLQAIWSEGMERSQVPALAQTLMDSLGPRLTGSPESRAAQDWTVSMYDAWGIDAHVEDYGTWRGWRRGVTHADLVHPRVRSLEATQLAWSPGTDGMVEGPVVALPTLSSSADVDAFVARASGAWVLLTPPEITCRPDGNWEEFAVPGGLEAMRAERSAYREAWNARLAAAGIDARELATRLDEAGAAGILTSRWSNGWGVQKVFGTWTQRVPSLDVSCEDYGLLHRLADNDQGPVIRVQAQSEDLGQVPVGNVIAAIPGSELPDEYVLLSAHFDSWDGGSGATDNGTGTVVMMEAMRLLRAAYPNPRRTILVGHWNGEEQGLNGSRAFAADRPEVVDGLQALFNQDNGTGRVVNISMQGLTEAGRYFGDWLTRVPGEITRHITLGLPGRPGGGGSDYASFICAGAPAFGLSSLSWDYGTYTWHTNRDTFDKIVLDEVRSNAVLTAMLAYMASEEPDRLPRDRRVLPPNPRTGEPSQWPTCRDGARSGG
jgi:carboxypeptidase Q